MSKYIQFLLVIVYGFLTITALLVLRQLLDIGPHHMPDWLGFTIIACWLIICFSAVYWFTDIFLFFQNARKPIFEEEQRLLLCMQRIQTKAKDNKHYRLRVAEALELNAYAIGHHTIVVNKGCLNLFNDDELSALLAHEMGHLRSKDCMAIMAFSLAQSLPNTVDGVFRRGIKIAVILGLLVALFGIIMLFFIFTRQSIFIYVGSILLFIAFLQLINPVFRFLWLLNSRYTEYRQDAFAQQLGYGLALRQVLIKLADSTPPQPVNRYWLITRSSHPLLHNRIRRLEKLEKLRG